MNFWLTGKEDLFLKKLKRPRKGKEEGKKIDDSTSLFFPSTAQHLFVSETLNPRCNDIFISPIQEAHQELSPSNQKLKAEDGWI